MSDVTSAAGQALAVAPHFEASAAPLRVEPLGRGHIHVTFHAIYADSDRDLVLQQLNEHVFPDLEAVMGNIAAVTGHLRRRGGGARGTLELVAATGGELLVRDSMGAAWRAFRFVAGTRSYDAVPNDDVARAAAHAFGSFAAALADLDPGGLAVPIPHFHDLSARLGQLREAAGTNSVGRLEEVTAECDAILGLGDTIGGALARGGASRLPRRVVHNDCKVNNLLFDEATGEPLCVVDLDTVMPGPVLVDFGELVRTAACDAAEGELDLSRVVYSPSRFEALADGYLAGVGPVLTPSERTLLWAGPPWMALENAARFLADHLGGDRYFRSGDNRARACAQLRLAEQLWEARDALRSALR